MPRPTPRSGKMSHRELRRAQLCTHGPTRTRCALSATALRKLKGQGVHSTGVPMCSRSKQLHTVGDAGVGITRRQRHVIQLTLRLQPNHPVAQRRRVQRHKPQVGANIHYKPGVSIAQQQLDKS